MDQGEGTRMYRNFVAPAFDRGIQNKSLFAALVLALVLSAFDAVATIQHIAAGVAIEGNPLMKALIRHGDMQFFFAKLLLTAVALWLCYWKREQLLGRFGIWLATACYTLVLIYHLIIYGFAPFN